MIKIQKVSVSKNDKGWILENLGEKIKSEGIDVDSSNMHLVSLKKDFVRGNHKHLENTEVFIILNGKIICAYKEENKKIEKIEIDTRKIPVAIVVPPKVTHALKTISPETVYFFAYLKNHEKYEKEIILE